MGVILGLYRKHGKEKGNYRDYMGVICREYKVLIEVPLLVSGSVLNPRCACGGSQRFEATKLPRCSSRHALQ